MHRKLLAAALASLLSAPAPAQIPEPGLLDPIVVTATRIPTAASAVLADVSVIARATIESSGAANLADLLQSQAGLELGTSGGVGSHIDVYLRGGNSNHLVVYLDGQRIGSATAGSAALEHLPLAMIERIEILRAPASSLYGMDAMAGVIQIFTRAGAQTGPRLALGLGGNARRSVDLGYGLQRDRLSLDVQGSCLESGGFSATNSKALFGGYNPDADNYRNCGINGRASWAWQDGEAGVNLFHTRSRNDFDMGPATDDYSRQNLGNYALHLKQRLAPGWESRVQLGQSVDDMETFGGAPSTFRTTQDQLLWENTLRLGDVAWLLGAEYLHQKVGSTTAFIQKGRRVTGLFAGADYRHEAHQVEASLRHDHNDQFGDQTTGSLRYGWQFAPAWRFQAGIGSAFKAPTFNDLYFPFTDYSYPPFFTYSYAGNPKLLPERSLNRDLGVKWARAADELRVSAYQNRVNDLIVASNGTATDFPVNVGHAEMKGVEASWRHVWPGWEMNLNGTVQAAQDGVSGRWLPRRARQHGSLSVRHHAGPWDATLEWLVSGRRYDDLANSRELPGYGLVNLSAGYAIAKAWRLEGRLGNAFDKDYELAYGYNTPGRNLFLSLRFTPL